jgi:hypothetical protein
MTGDGADAGTDCASREQASTQSDRGKQSRQRPYRESDNQSFLALTEAIFEDYIRTLLIATAVLQFSIGGEFAVPVQAREPAGKAHKGDSNTATPIKHVIVIVGEKPPFRPPLCHIRPDVGRNCE